MTKDFQERRQEFMGYLGDPDAVEFLELVFDITDVWDDMVDRDRDVTDAHINNTFTKCLVHLPGNLFYRKHYPVLAPQLMLVINAWQDANELEKGDESDRVYACGLRFLLVQLVATCVSLIKGPDAARKISVEAWRNNTSDEPTLQWVKKGGE
jgi:hypothetical protein